MIYSKLKTVKNTKIAKNNSNIRKTYQKEPLTQFDTIEYLSIVLRRIKVFCFLSDSEYSYIRT